MPSNELPKMLNIILDTILGENCVISWNVRGVKDYTQLSIRFGGDADSEVRNAPPEWSGTKKAGDMERHTVSNAKW